MLLKDITYSLMFLYLWNPYVKHTHAYISKYQISARDMLSEPGVSFENSAAGSVYLLYELSQKQINPQHGFDFRLQNTRSVMEKRLFYTGIMRLGCPALADQT